MVNIYSQISDLLGVDIPIRDCNIVLVDLEDSKSCLLLKSLSVPDSGVDFSIVDALGFLPNPSIKMSAISIEGYMLRADINKKSDFISSFYYSQFQNGLLRITNGKRLAIRAQIPIEEKDTVITDLLAQNDMILRDGYSFTTDQNYIISPIMTFSGCFCSAPKYTAGHSSNKFVTVSTSIYYKNFTNDFEL